MTKRKPKTPAKLANECAVDLQLLVRLKAADKDGNCQCVSCGVVKHWSELQGGHYIAAKNAATRLIEENIHSQCRQCNGYNMEMRHPIYTRYMDDMYGKEFVDELIAMIGKPHTWRKSEIAELHKEIKRQVEYFKRLMGITND